MQNIFTNEVQKQTKKNNKKTKKKPRTKLIAIFFNIKLLVRVCF